MKTIKRFIIFIAIIFLIGGSVCLAFAIKNNTFAQKDTNDKTYEIEGDFQNLNIDLSIDDFEIKLSTDGKNSLVCQEYENMSHSVLVKDNSLNVIGKDERKWYEKIFILDWNFKPIKTILYLNKDSFDNIEINGSVGSVLVGDDFNFTNAKIKLSTGSLLFSANVISSLNIELTTGSVKINDINCETFNAKSSTGDIRLNNVIASKAMNIEASTGNVNLNEVDAETIYVKVSTGNISGVILTPKTFEAHASTGKVNVPKDTTGGLCTLIASTGNINVSIKK